MRCSTCGSDNRDDSRFCHQCAAPLTPFPAAPAPNGQTLIAAFENLSRGTLFAGRYEIIEELGKGGMGSVYKTFDQKLQEVVALKIIRPELGFNTAAVDRFKSELKNARKIAHRHVCRLYDLGEAGLVHFLTMEYVEGEDLKKFIRRAGPIGPGRAAGIARQIAEGLGEAHRVGVIHRDLKPQNIMIDRDGRVRIMDFGLSRFLESDGLTKTGVMLGTPEYMSPEQVELLDVDARSDLYAVGIMLFEMLTGKVPFEGQTPLAVAIKHKNEPAPDARETNPLVPEPLVRIIYHCLEKDPAKRYPDADALAADLTAVENDLPSIVREISKADYRTPKPARTPEPNPKKARFVIWAAVALAALAAPFIWKALRPSASPEKFSTRSAAVQDQPDISRDHTGPTSTDRRSGSRGIPSESPGSVREALAKYYKSLEPKDLDEAEKIMGGLKIFLPEKGPVVEAWNNVFSEIRRQRDPARKIEIPALPNPPPGAKTAARQPPALQGDMQKLLALVAEREGAAAAKKAMGTAKAVAQKAGVDDQKILFRLARFEEGNADDAYQKNDFSSAKALYLVLEKAFALSTFCGQDAGCVNTLRNFVLGLKGEAARLPAAEVDPWILEIAREIERQADGFLERKDLENAGGAYLRSAFLYQKIKDAAAQAAK